MKILFEKGTSEKFGKREDVSEGSETVEG